MAETPRDSSASDRNLLFGAMALRLGFIRREQLDSAARAWAANQGEPLADVLVNQRALSADARARLEPLVATHIEHHGGDVHQSLRALDSTSELECLLKPIVNHLETTACWPSAAGSGPVPAPLSNPANPGRFHILRPHAKGGLGEVFVARDAELNREVALKEIQTEYAFQSEHWSRFLMEAEITGSLEHPGVVPVYGLGSYADGRPYYAMRFIKGDSLQEAIRRFHEKDELKRDPQERSLALRELLGRFVDVCQAIGYAHSRGVVHRDLKPGNVMLGKFGETLVVDWGLAKTLAPASGDNPDAPNPGARAPAGDEVQTLVHEFSPRPLAPAMAGTATLDFPPAERPITPRASASGQVATQMGQAIGTPAYMSPEQAAGRLDQLGPASDVYSLGATLYHLLAGRPPFQEQNLAALLKHVQLGEFPRPRAVKSSVPPALEAVCLRAMALKPTDRYGSSQELAAEVERWLADEPVQAYREPWSVRTRRWLGRHRVATTSAAVAAVMAIAGLAIVLFLTKASEERERGLREEETAAKELANHNLTLAQAAEQQEIRQQKLAQARLEKGVEAIERMVSRVTGETWANRPELDHERREVLEEAILFFKQLGSEGSHDPAVRRQAARAYLQCGNVQSALGEYRNSEASAEIAVKLYQGLVDQFPKDSAARHGLVDATLLLAGLHTLSGRYQTALGLYEKAVGLADEAAANDPGGEGTMLAQGDARVALARYHMITNPAKSQKLYADALVVSEKLLARPNPSYRARLQAAMCLVNQGVGEMSQGRNSQANVHFERARVILAPIEHLAAPNVQSASLLVQTQSTLDVFRGSYMCRQGKNEEGLAIIKQGIDRVRRMQTLTPNSFVYQFLTMQDLIVYGQELTRQGKVEEAQQVFVDIDSIRAKLLADLPQMAWLRTFGDMQKSELLITKAQKGKAAGTEREMDELLKRAEERLKPALQYNSACLYARLAESSPKTDREHFAGESVKRLNELLGTAYFESQSVRDHLNVDPDLAPLRDRPDFQNFLQRAKAVRPKSP